MVLVAVTVDLTVTHDVIVAVIVDLPIIPDGDSGDGAGFDSYTIR